VVGKWSQYVRQRLIGKAECFNGIDSLTLFVGPVVTIAPHQSFMCCQRGVRPIPCARLAAARLPPACSRALKRFPGWVTCGPECLRCLRRSLRHFDSRRLLHASELRKHRLQVLPTNACRITHINRGARQRVFRAAAAILSEAGSDENTNPRETRPARPARADRDAWRQSAARRQGARARSRAS